MNTWNLYCLAATKTEVDTMLKEIKTHAEYLEWLDENRSILSDSDLKRLQESDVLRSAEGTLRMLSFDQAWI